MKLFNSLMFRFHNPFPERFVSQSTLDKRREKQNNPELEPKWINGPGFKFVRRSAMQAVLERRVAREMQEVSPRAEAYKDATIPFSNKTSIRLVPESNNLSLAQGTIPDAETRAGLVAQRQYGSQSGIALSNRASEVLGRQSTPSSERKSVESLKTLQRRIGVQNQVDEFIEKFQEEFAKNEEGNFLNISELPMMEQLADKSLAFKEEFMNRVIGTSNSTAIHEIFPCMKLGHSAGESMLRQRVLQHLVEEERGAAFIANHIADFNPSENDMSLLLSLGEKIAKDANLAFANYLSSLQNIGRNPYGNPGGQPFRLPLEVKLNLLKTWLLHAPSQVSHFAASPIPDFDAFEMQPPFPHTFNLPDSPASSYLQVEKHLSDAGLFAIDSKKIPVFMRKLHDSIAPGSEPREHISVWLRYSAAHMIGRNIPSSEQFLLEKAYLALAAFQEQTVLYGGSQIIGKAIENPLDSVGLFSALEKFNDKTLGIFFYAAIGNDERLSSSFSSVLNRQEKSIQSQQAVINFSDFAGTDKIDLETKQRLLKMYEEKIATAIDPFAECIDMMQKMGRIGLTVNQENTSKLSKLYKEWLPRCTELQQLEMAVEPDQAFISRLVQMQVIAGAEEVGLLLLSLKRAKNNAGASSVFREPIDIEPVDLVNEVVGYLKNAIRVWQQDDANGLLEKVRYVSTEVLGLGIFEKEIFDQPEIANNCKHLKEIADQAIREENNYLRTWAEMAGLLMLDTEEIVRDSTFVKDMLSTIAEFRGEQHRIPVTVCFYRSIHDQSVAAQFEEFSALFTRKHSRIFAPPLFILSNNGDPQSIEEIKALIKIVKDQRFRDTQKAIPLLTFISEMALTKSIDIVEKRRIVGVLGEDSLTAKNGVSSRMICINGLAKLADAGSDDSATAIAALRRVNDLDSASIAAKVLLQIFFSVPGQEIDRFIDDFENYLNTSRAPAALLSYASSIYFGIKEPAERKRVMAEITLLAKSLIARDDGVVVNTIRYGTKDNAHNAHIQRNTPMAWQYWQEEMQLEEEMEYSPEDLDVAVDPLKYLAERIIFDGHVSQGTFPLLERVLSDQTHVEDALAKLDSNDESRLKDIERQLLLAVRPGITKEESARSLADLPLHLPFPQLARDIKDLKKKLTAPPLSLDKCKNLRASISSKPEDLFLIGTEVAGSCQSIYGMPELNKALPGYVLDGKYLSAQVTNKNGVLMSRRILRLLWSEQHSKPVIYVEREYSNPGVPQKIKDATLDLIRQKASRMGALVATDDEELVDVKGKGMGIGRLRAYGSQHPYEYVDALGGVQENGEYTIANAKPMKYAS